MVRDAQLKFTRELSGALTIQSVSAEGVRVDGEIFAETIAITTQVVLDSWRPVAVCDLVADDFSILLDYAPELVILGTGSCGEFPPRELTFAFARLGIGLEVMDTAAAARTFNVLAGEGRRVAAVLYR